MNRINLICLGVQDMERSVKFYRDELGFQTDETSDRPDIIFFNTSGTKLELYPLEALAKDIDAEHPPVKSGFSGVTLAYNAKSRDEVDQVMELAKKAGAVIVKQPVDVFWGGYSGYFQDPDGYHWEVAYGSDFKFDSQDMLDLGPRE
ncbi:VOC family protein [Planococcus sp. A6]|uniref:VOC family protein n=1 Tax=Planococcus sp. A6 TaxID=2992760 RepID=UPI00237BEF0F|nr:VOC family protein [Planococcus sp. A6]MDE0583133.1 VOC family protein [Planococcus sp. A6]